MQIKTIYISLAQIMQTKTIYISLMAMWFTFCILASVQCTELVLYDMILMSEENTRALVTAMRDRVQTVVLYAVTLDIEELTQYDGRGRCRELQVWDEMRWRYGARLREWAALNECECHLR